MNVAMMFPSLKFRVTKNKVRWDYDIRTSH